MRTYHFSRSFLALPIRLCYLCSALVGHQNTLRQPTANAKKKHHMKDRTDARPGSEEEDTEEQGDRRGQRSYASYSRIENFAFDPLKDLNLPGSYEEVVTRFKRLQVMRALEALN